jgi:hypothetical protein
VNVRSKPCSTGFEMLTACARRRHEIRGASALRRRLNGGPHTNASMERGDYSGAVRRITTALEVVVESVLAGELTRTLQPAEVEKRLKRSRANFPGRVLDYQKLSGRVLPVVLRRDIERTRSIRHEIVHAGRRISFSERGLAQRAVDTGRWAFSWFENLPDRGQLRERNLALKSVGRALAHAFQADLTASWYEGPRSCESDPRAPSLIGSP